MNINISNLNQAYKLSQQQSVIHIYLRRNIDIFKADRGRNTLKSNIVIAWSRK